MVLFGCESTSQCSYGNEISRFVHLSSLSEVMPHSSCGGGLCPASDRRRPVPRNLEGEPGSSLRPIHCTTVFVSFPLVRSEVYDPWSKGEQPKYVK